MATYHEIPRPPRPKGAEEEFRAQIYNYLYRLSEQLQAIVNGLAAQHDGSVQPEEGGTQNGV